jgi:hypothetical protein
LHDLREIIKEEYKRCAGDPVHMFKKYSIIQHPKKGKITFNLYPFQEMTLEQIKKHRFNIILKSRQMGISTLVAAYALWCMLFRNDFNVLVIATRQDVARNLVKKVQVMHDSLPVWLRRKTTNKNRLSISFDNGSEIKAVSSSSDAARSEALSLLIIDECAFIDNADDIWTSAQMTLATGGDAILLSTPNGVGNLFHRLWVKAEEGRAEEGLDLFNPIRLNWDLHPERDETWRRQQDEQLGPRQAAQECDCDFISSGHTVVEGEVLKWYEDTYVQDPVEKRGLGGDYWVWRTVDYSRQYMVVADVARGDGADYSGFHVLDIETLEQVAEYKGQMGTREYGNFLVEVATSYNDAVLVIDNKNIGWDTVQQVLDRGYRNLFYSDRNDPYLDENIHIRKNMDLKDKKDKVPGFTTTSRNRPVMISKLETYLRERIPILRSKRLLNELFVFKWINGRAEAANSYNDDLVMALAMALFVRETALRMHQMGLDLTRRTMKIYRPAYKPKPAAASQWEQDLGGTKGKEDLSWLVRRR